jgi:MerR family transcriptional regulator, thiopeptide resistance regulator
MLTISRLARRAGLSRSTILYYEARGLLKPPKRTGGNYRAYAEADVSRLQQIGLYRKVGLSLTAVRSVLDRPGGGAASILERRLVDIDAEIERLRDHQRAILGLLARSRSLRRTEMMTKDKWVSIMRAAGLSEEDMSRWHTEFEKAAPDDHQQFLEYLRITPEEIATIRQWSRSGKHP